MRRGKMAIAIMVTAFLVLITETVSAQSNARLAEKAWQNARYKDAAGLYLSEYHKDTTDLLVIERLAYSNKMIGHLDDAEKWFNALFTLNPSAGAAHVLSFAQVLASNKKYDLSRTWYKKYGEMQKEDKRGELFAKAYADMRPFYKDSAQWQISFLSINTSADEFAPLHLGKGLLFTSNRTHAVFMQNMSALRREPFTDIYQVSDTADIKRIPVPISTDYTGQYRKDMERTYASSDNKLLPTVGNRFLQDENPFFKATTPATKISSEVNTRFHDGNTTMNAEMDLMVFNTTSTVKDGVKDGFNPLRLRLVKFNKGEWKKAVDFKYNNSSYNLAHPALSPDGDVLYFVSDMPGGYGGMDIYFSMKSDSGWSVPINLGPKVNTKANETFPYVDANHNLYFSTSGWPGLGGLDIFVVGLIDNKPASEVKNMGYPVNSSMDDFGITIRPDAYSGYFSSNRLKSDDIYHFRFR